MSSLEEELKEYLAAGGTVEEFVALQKQIMLESAIENQMSAEELQEKKAGFGITSDFPTLVLEVYENLRNILIAKESGSSLASLSKLNDEELQEQALTKYLEINNASLSKSLNLYISFFFFIPAFIGYFYIKMSSIYVALGAYAFFQFILWMVTPLSTYFKKLIAKDSHGFKSFRDSYIAEIRSSRENSDLTFLNEDIFENKGIEELNDIPLYATWEIKFENHCLNEVRYLKRYFDLLQEGKSGDEAFDIFAREHLTPKIDPATGKAVKGTPSAAVIADRIRMLKLLASNGLLNDYLAAFGVYGNWMKS
jgi:hypothetical protein